MQPADLCVARGDGRPAGHLSTSPASSPSIVPSGCLPVALVANVVVIVVGRRLMHRGNEGARHGPDPAATTPAARRRCPPGRSAAAFRVTGTDERHVATWSPSTCRWGWLATTRCVPDSSGMLLRCLEVPRETCAGVVEVVPVRTVTNQGDRDRARRRRPDRLLLVSGCRPLGDPAPRCGRPASRSSWRGAQGRHAVKPRRTVATRLSGEADGDHTTRHEEAPPMPAVASVLRSQPRQQARWGLVAAFGQQGGALDVCLVPLGAGPRVPRAGAEAGHVAFGGGDGSQVLLEVLDLLVAADGADAGDDDLGQLQQGVELVGPAGRDRRRRRWGRRRSWPWRRRTRCRRRRRRPRGSRPAGRRGGRS